MNRLVLPAIIALGFAPLAVAGLRLSDGQRGATIVLAADARDEAVDAAADLSRCLRQATGADFRVVTEGGEAPRSELATIYVGRCAALPAEDVRDLDALDRDGYLVHITDADTVFLAGPRPWSTYWAVCQFLEDEVGVRWLIPGELGEDIPKHDALSPAPRRQTYEPVILSRLWSGAQYGGKWSLRQRIHRRYEFHHNLIRIFDPAKYYDTHPEWYPLRANGKRYRPQGAADHSWQPCLASESSVQHAADAARNAWAEDPDRESFSYGCNDGQGWCVCDGCKAMDRPIESWLGFEGTYSYRYYTWLNKVAANLEKTHPANMLGCLAYSTYILPPEDIGLHRNIIPYFTSNRADYYEPEFRAQDQKLLEWWGRVAKQMGIYDYAYGMGFAIPRIYNHLFQEAIQHAVRNNVRGFYAEVYPNWGLDGPKLYVMSRVLWDPQIDIDRLSAEWNRRMFREAAAPMAAYFALCEKAWREQDTGRGHWAYRLAADPKQFEVFPPQVVSECRAHLDRAAELATSDLVRRRIRFFTKTWEITELLASNYWAGAELQRLIEEEAPLEQVAQAARTMAEQAVADDIDAYIDARVGEDPVAFYPPKAAWINPLKSGGTANALRLSASRLAQRCVKEAVAEGVPDADELRRAIARRIDSIFGSAGSEVYRGYVTRMKSMACKIATVSKAARAPVIDGDLSDPAWQHADVLTDFAKWGQAAPAANVTRGRLLHDGRTLYIALECMQDTSALVCDAAARDGSTWKDDSVEIFINPGLAQFPYIQFIVNAKGAFFDLWGRKDGESYSERVGVNFNARWKTAVEPDRWTAELALPLDEFDCAPKPDSLLRFNLARNVQGEKAEISAWFLSVKAHADPLSRGWLVFE
jgi:hypothetical protein